MPKHRLDWDGRQNIVILDDDKGGHVEIGYGDFLRIADRLITDIMSSDTVGWKKSFKRLPLLVKAMDAPGGKA